VNDIIVAFNLVLAVGLGLDALDTERYLPGPPEMSLFLDKGNNNDLFCYGSGPSAEISIAQPLYRTSHFSLEAHATHRSCAFEDKDAGTYNLYGIGIRVPLNFY